VGGEGRRQVVVRAWTRTSSTRCLAMLPWYRLFLRHCAAISSYTSQVRARCVAAWSMQRSACRQAATPICAISDAGGAVSGACVRVLWGAEGSAGASVGADASASCKLIGLTVS
jgi:hypothetical protein